VPVKVPRVRDRGGEPEKVRFTSTILPPYLRKAKSIEELLPWLYLKVSVIRVFGSRGCVI
jgi:hypothetical protein